MLSGIEGAALAYMENGTAAAITATLAVSDVDSANLSSATVSISSNFASGQDVLGFTNQNGITGSYSAGVLSLSGSSSVANYQTALRSVTYYNSSDSPSTLTRTISFQVNDGVGNSNTVTRNVTVTAVNDVPVRTAGTLTPISVAENSANATAVTLGLRGVTYGPGGGADESKQTLTYTLTSIPSFVRIFKADGTTPVNLNGTVTAAELQGLKYKTVVNAYGSGNLTWTVTDNGTPPQTLTENLAITVTAPNHAPVLDNTKTPVLSVEDRGGKAPSGPVGTLVSSLVDFATPSGQVDNVTDVDRGAQLGIAVVAADTRNGVWWFSTNNGTNWSPLGIVGNSSAPPASSGRQYADLFSTERQLHLHACQRNQVPGLGSDQRRQRRPCQYVDQRRHECLLIGHRHRDRHGERGQPRSAVDGVDAAAD